MLLYLKNCCCLMLVMFFSIYSMAQTVPRSYALDLLPAIRYTKAEIFVKKEEEMISWSAFLNPFSKEMWLVLTIVALVFSFGLTIVGKIFSFDEQSFMIIDCLKNLWIALKANVGGKPNKIQENTMYQILLFNCLLVGSVIWMAYRASLTSELSVRKFKLPFNSLENLLVSDYK